jgi:hypothetical protein
MIIRNVSGLKIGNKVKQIIENNKIVFFEVVQILSTKLCYIDDLNGQKLVELQTVVIKKQD